MLELLRAARAEAQRISFAGFGTIPVGLELALRCPRDRLGGDATNYLGGIVDVPDDKACRGTLEHLGDLAAFSLYVNDRQIEAVQYRWEPAGAAVYNVGLCQLDAAE